MNRTSLLSRLREQWCELAEVETAAQGGLLTGATRSARSSTARRQAGIARR